MYRTHTFDYITEALCFLNENNIDKDNIITLTNGGVHWLLVWYEPEQANEETERKFYNIEILGRGAGVKAKLNSIYGIMNNPDAIYIDTDSIKVRSDGDGESKQPEDSAEAD